MSLTQTRDIPLKAAALLARDAVLETLWPTRCALCDRPGDVLCAQCASNLPILDQWRACPRCGAPFGLKQCDLCNPTGLGRLGRDELPFADCRSALHFTAATGELVRIYKDQGEQRLCEVFAGLIAPMLPPRWTADAITFIPATKAALARRGFDHGRLLAQALSSALQVPLVEALLRPRTADQRNLSARGRFSNLQGKFVVKPHAALPPAVLLVDDVFTTGATLCAGADALQAARVREVYGATLARV